MTVKGKASGAVLTVLAPEAKVAQAAAGGASSAGAGTGMVPGSRKKVSGSAAGHRAKIDQIKAQRPAGDDATDQQPSGPSRGRRAWDATKAAATDQTGSPDWYQKATNPDPIKAANTGGGFVLGVLIWVGVRCYLEGGADGVKKLLKAKFLNKVDA